MTQVKTKLYSSVIMLRAVFPGSFDPPTNGHVNLIERASKIFGAVDLVIAENKDKKYLFNAAERIALMRSICKPYKNVEVHLWDRLIVDYAKEKNIGVVIRGVRALADFGYEFELAMTNKNLHPGIETIFMPTDPKYFVLRSSAIKEIAMFGGDVSQMVPEEVVSALKMKLSSS